MVRLLGIDLGTSGCKALAIDETGKVLAQSSAEYPLRTPKPGWSEQDPEDWWNGIQRCLSALGGAPPDAIGLTGQMHGAVFLNSADRVIRPAILWNDQRTVEECEEIDRAVGRANVRRITCNPPLTGFQAPKLLWLRNNELGNYQKLRSIMLPKDYIRFRLTGEKATEVSDASGTGLFDVPNRCWSSEMMAALEFDPGWFPPSAESSVVTARTSGVGGIPAGIPVVGGGGDQAAGAIGCGVARPGIISVSLGTSGVVFTALASPQYDPGGATHTFCHANGEWHSMGVMLSCGGALRWYRDTVAPGQGYEQIAHEAAEAPAGSDRLTFLPYLSGERTPHNDPMARGAWCGLSLAHSRAHLARAVFEGVTFAVLDGLRLLEQLGATTEEIRVAGGGARSPFWRQMLADIFRLPCATLESDEGPAFGAAILAGVGIGVWPSLIDASLNTVRILAKTEPQDTDYASAYERYRALYGSTKEWVRT